MGNNFSDMNSNAAGITNAASSASAQEILLRLKRRRRLSIIIQFFLRCGLTYISYKILISAMCGGFSNYSIVQPKDIDINFESVAGCEEAKIEIIEIVDFLKNRKKYEKLGAVVPKGAILHGPPGTGKTLLAKACAKEAGVPFIHCSGSDFIGMYAGVGSKRVRNLFSKAKKLAPCIVFIDEIDSIAISRTNGASPDGHSQSINNEYNQVINALLAEMDGFKTSKKPVVVLAATNRVESLDKAIMRPGRLDKKIAVGLPDIAGRSKIFNVHLKNLDTEDDKDELAKYLAVKTPGMTGADIKNICNEAALHAVRYDQDQITKLNFDAAIDRVTDGIMVGQTRA